MAYIDDVNDHGGVNGRKIRVLHHDDKYEADAALIEFPKIMKEGVFLIAGLYGSAPLARVYMPSAMSNKIPVIGIHSGPIFIDKPVKRYVFGVRASYRDEMKQAVDSLWKDGMRSFGIIYQNDAYGSDCLEGVQQALKAHGADVVAAGSYTRNSNNLGEAFEVVHKANPQVVILAAVYTPCAQAVKLAHEANWDPLFVMNSGTSVDLFITEAGDNANGKLFTEVFPSPERTEIPVIAQYRKDLLKYFPDEKPGYVSLRGYMDAYLMVEGMKRAGKNLTREGFVNAMESIHDLDVGLGKEMLANYSGNDHLGFHKVFLGSIKNNKVSSSTDWKERTATIKK